MSETRIFLKTAEGRTVRREEDAALWPAEGDWAETSLFIRRRLADGDLVKAAPPKASAANADKPAGGEK